ncbi:hypothetical protein [Alkalinema sp. FACHB-956]|uniref:hypothetical protein n=1 Tax=Alkalinema sp. FACHB-956 TaxID=2692768 RepID=UPI0016833C92|nr:hypothetical protein [Alkalinema sp. FACHB-956]MBD2329702.1 hypothetical protein [Alkalinema sp. FACHB-956]
MTLPIHLEFDFQDQTAPEKQETQTQMIFQQGRMIPGVTMERVVDPNPPEGIRSPGRVLWGLLQAEVSPASLKNLFGFLGDRLGNKPIKIKAKFADGREFELEASSQAELATARTMLEELSKIH